ncbi:MAG: polysaccharide deacetylase family protein [Candidatus Atribacteria bacterium]|nr:polysaccharide deacetylase family protein [Candidatus Atribacteria bacterium]
MSSYLKIRSLLSKKNKGRLTRFLIWSGFKPRVNKNVVSPFQKGIVVFSADFEMAWAFRYSKKRSDKAVEMGLKERANFPKILSLFDKYNIPVTWATVGHLFLNNCEKDVNGLAHPEMKRPGYFTNKNWIFNSGDWYQHDPCTNLKVDPAWYAEDLIDDILNSKTKHEIGCHTFSHTDFTYNNCPPELAISELDACINHAKAKGIELRSMVFPGGTAGNFEALKQKGFTCYRKPMKYHIDLPYIDNCGLVAIPSSLSLEKDNYGWSSDYHLYLLQKYLKKVSEYKLVCHFWFHPSMDYWYLTNVLPGLIRMVDRYKVSGKIEVLTMNQLTDKVISKTNFLNNTNIL